MQKWSVYKRVKRGLRTREAIPLGHVKADNQPAALLKAFAKWPKDVDLTRPQGGFSAVPVEKDHMSLGTAGRV